MGSMTAPTSVRLLNDAEWKIVERVFTADKLPYRWRLLVTNGAGADGRAFTIPTSLLTMAAPAAFFAAVTKNPLITAIVAVGSAAIGTALSFMNAGYIMSVGLDSYGDLTAIDLGEQDYDAQALLVHETTCLAGQELQVGHELRVGLGDQSMSRCGIRRYHFGRLQLPDRDALEGHVSGTAG